MGRITPNPLGNKGSISFTSHVNTPMAIRCNTHFWPWLVRPRGGWRKVHITEILTIILLRNESLLGWNFMVWNWNEPLPCPLWRLTYHRKNIEKLSLTLERVITDKVTENDKVETRKVGISIVKCYQNTTTDRFANQECSTTFRVYRTSCKVSRAIFSYFSLLGAAKF